MPPPPTPPPQQQFGGDVSADSDVAELLSRIPRTPSTTTPNRLRREADIQMNVRLAYSGSASISISTQLQVNAPAPAFIALPVTLELTDLAFAGTAVFALCRRRACVCFLNPANEPVDDEFGGHGASPAALLSPLRGLKVHSKVGLPHPYTHAPTHPPTTTTLLAV